MSQRKTVNGRPSGTDGSDYSYRMVVDSRYQKVADGNSRLILLIWAQGNVQHLAVLIILYTLWGGGNLDRLAVLAVVISFVSLIIGEFGRKRSRVSLLKLFMFGTSVATLISVACILKSEQSVEIIKDFNRWATSKVELLKIAGVSLGVLLQVFILAVTTSLIHNMAPPKRAS